MANKAIATNGVCNLRVNFAIVMVLLRHGHERYLESKLYGKENDINLTNKNEKSQHSENEPDDSITDTSLPLTNPSETSKKGS